MKRYIPSLLLILLALTPAKGFTYFFGGTATGSVVSPIVLDNSVAGASTSALNCTATLTTTLTNDEWVVYYYVTDVQSTPHASTVTSPNLTWTKRTASSQSTTGAVVDVEEWYAPATTALTSEVVTVTGTSPSANSPSCRTIVLAYNGVNTTTPFDVNVSLPAISQVNTSATSATTSISTTNANSVAVSFFRNFGSAGTITPPAGYTLAVSGFSSTATGIEYKVYNTAQSSTSVGYSWTTASANGILLTDALQAR